MKRCGNRGEAASCGQGDVGPNYKGLPKRRWRSIQETAQQLRNLVAPLAGKRETGAQEPERSMETIFDLLAKLDEKTIAREVDLPIDTARERYPLALRRAQLGSAESVIHDYYQYLISSHLGIDDPLFSPEEAVCQVHDLLEGIYGCGGQREYTAFYETQEGVEGGLPAVLDRLTDAYKKRLREAHVNMALRECRLSHAALGEMILQFRAFCGHELPVPIRESNFWEHLDYETFRRIIVAYAQGRDEVLRNLERC
jgi:hypothetical protein